MNGNFFGIQVKQTNGYSAVINVESIDSIHEKADCVEIVAGNVPYYVPCTMEEAIAAITKHCTVLVDMPKLGYEQEQPETVVIDEPEAESSEVATPATTQPNEVEKRVAEMINDYNELVHLDVLDHVFCNFYINVYADGNDDFRRVEYIYVSDGELYVDFPQKRDVKFSSLPVNVQESILDELSRPYCWDIVYQTLVNTPLDNYVNVYNLTVEPKERILPNTKESLDAFGMTAGELMKSMVNGNYKKDEGWIYIDNGELRSTNDPGEAIDTVELTDWVVKHSNEAKQILPADIYSKAFE